MAASFPRVTVLILLEVIFSGMYSANFMQQLNLIWFLKLSTGLDPTMENDGSFVPQGYGVDISRGNIFWNVFCEFHATIEFDLVFEVINWF